MYVENVVMIQFAASATAADRQAVYADLDAVVVRDYDRLNFTYVEISRGTTPEAIARWSGDPRVEIIEANARIFADGPPPSDPEFPKQWHLQNTGQPATNFGPGTPGADVDARRAWCITQGHPDALVAVLDTGVFYDHPDLQSSIFRNPGEIADNGIDDDGNGFVDDVRGWNFEGVQDGGIGDNDPNDTSGHGTLVAGVIAAAADGVGSVGVAPEASVLPVRVLTNTATSPPSGTNLEVALGIYYAVDMGADILNCSFGSNIGSGLLSQALEYANAHGALAVCAAGNSRFDNDAIFFYPASYDLPNVIAVAASDPTDRHASSFSNYGVETVELVAPGVDIWGTIVRRLSPGVLYGSSSGTSFAAPQVSGALALIETIAPELVVPHPFEVITDNVDVVPELRFLVESSGRLNAHRALASLLPVDNVGPAKVEDLRVSDTGSNWIELEWTAPGDDGMIGQACCYDLRFGFGDFDFADGIRVGDSPEPRPAGETQRFRVDGFDPETEVTFAFRTFDEGSGISQISNVVTGVTNPPDFLVQEPLIVLLGPTGTAGSFEVHLENLADEPLTFEATADAPYLEVLTPGGTMPVGGTAEVDVDFDFTGLGGGTLHTTLRVVDADGSHEIDVPVEARVIAGADLRVMPSAVDFGPTFVGVPAVRTVEVANIGFRPLVVEAITADEGVVLDGVGLPLTVAAGESETLALEYTPGSSGPQAEAFELQSNDPTDEFTPMSLTSFAIAMPRVELVPADLTVPGLTNRPTDPFPVTVRNVQLEGPNLDARFTVLAADGGPAPGWVAVEPASVQVAPGGEAEIELRLSTAGLLPGTEHAILRVESNDAGRPDFEVPITFEVAGQATLVVDGARVDFGSIPAGTFREEALRIENTGDIPLDVALDVRPPFAALPSSLTVPPGETGHFGVRYRPDEATGDASLLRVRTNDPERPLVTLSLVGQARSEGQWSGTIFLDRPLTVPADEMLRLAPGTQIEAVPLEEPGRDGVSCLLEVRGELDVDGSEDDPVTFNAQNAAGWTGIVVDGRARASHWEITGAATGLEIRDGGAVSLRCSRIAGNDTGIRYDGTFGTELVLRGVELQNRRVNVVAGGTYGLEVGGDDDAEGGRNVFRVGDDIDALNFDVLDISVPPFRLDGNSWIYWDGTVLSDESVTPILGSLRGLAWTNSTIFPTRPPGDLGCEDEPIGPDPGAATLGFARRLENPVRGPLDVDFDLPPEFRGRVRLQVFDVRGARVRSLVDRETGPGRFVAPWDLADHGGQQVGAGVYFVRFEAGAVTQTKKLVVLR